MEALKTKEIRKKYIDFFVSKGHTHVPSLSLVPFHDPTLLFTNAGMVQFKDVFLGLEQRPYTKAVTAQRCVRAGGKHNDLETVGRTARHHTFFEMMGNFSFGDYFKKEAITYAWEFLTKVLELPIEKLYVTVYDKDEEAYQLWQEIAGLSEDRIYRIGTKDNFWSMGDTGPCGPCSEIFFDRGEVYGCDAKECAIGKCDCDRWMEIWNLVFMQYNRDEAGNLNPLPRPSIDTGMGLERVASIMQQVDSNYDIDIMCQIINGVSKLCGKAYQPGPEGFPFRVIADHARACSFLIADGVMPGNEGRGYVLRRILRRAARLGKSLDLHDPFLYKMVPYVKDSLIDAYPELEEKEEMITKVIKIEEERFHRTLQDGLLLAEDAIAKAKAQNKNQISGETAFLLYDTYGFPLDLTKDIAAEKGLLVDSDGFENAMCRQRERARIARTEMENGDSLAVIGQLLANYPPTPFIGYEQLVGNATVDAILIQEEIMDTVLEGEEGYLILSQTPFYGESGGQEGDGGELIASGAQVRIINTKKMPSGVILHKFLVTNGILNLGDQVKAKVDEAQRRATAANHSATHLLHRALRKRLGDHVHQAGSLVSKDALRFDFAHFSPLTKEELADVENEINEVILRNLPICLQEMPLEKAKSLGAMAFFGDKYGDVVRMVSIGNYSKELCGGTHLTSTGGIGLIKILSESGIGAGMRRMEAITGMHALRYYQEREQILDEMAASMKTVATDAQKRLDVILAEHRMQKKELEKSQDQSAKNFLNDLIDSVQEYDGIKVLVGQAPACDVVALRKHMDFLRDKLPDAAIVLATVFEDKVLIAATVSQKAQSKGLHAGNLVKEAAAVCGGGGGGRPDMAQAGGKDVQKITDALKHVSDLIHKTLTN